MCFPSHAQLPVPAAHLVDKELLHFDNEACLPVLGHCHPAALGRPALEVWAEAGPTIDPQAEAVMPSWVTKVALPPLGVGLYDVTAAGR